MATVHKSQRSRPVRNAVVGTGRLSVDGQKEASNGYVYKEDQYVNGNQVDESQAPRVDLSKLKVQALRKYTKVYDVPGISPHASKEDLTSAVSKHWSTMTVSEESVLLNLMRIRSRH
ncbi:hypothetical protein H632_c213p0 [Helicosporidium sp. ATCC 50920]|nr:hypothetical protein H632_c213p0 [Helicosporidium sp. ATCC 50920]|eukprot:KDD76474.1 hypothetical protein H632_c213p0 [Helicosporidium sp. ATCC 50920]